MYGRIYYHKQWRIIGMWMKTTFSTFSNIIQTIIGCKYKETGSEMI